MLLREVVTEVSAKGGLLRVTGEISASGFRGLGLSAESIAPAMDLPLRSRFDFAPDRANAPLRLRDLRLASVTGEADCELKAGGNFMLHLNGELAPASLDRVLGGADALEDDWRRRRWRQRGGGERSGGGGG